MISGVKKRIGFRQKVPYKVLENGLYQTLQRGKTDSLVINRDLQEHFAGANRLSKAASTANLILNKNEYVIERLRQTVSPDVFIKLTEPDRKALITCLLCLAYPIAYDCLVTIASVFKLQDAISRDLLHQKMSALYGSNRSVYIAVGELLPTFMDLGFLSRVKTSVYRRNPPFQILHPAITEVLVYTDIKLSNANSILVDDMSFRPWYDWFEVSAPKALPSNLIRFADGVIGRGYLTAV